jgi:hypothetical protein
VDVSSSLQFLEAASEDTQDPLEGLVAVNRSRGVDPVERFYNQTSHNTMIKY